MEELIRNYFKSWIDQDIDVLEKTFAENIIYSECYGPEYHGLDQVRRWFTDWNKRGKVLVWDIKKMICTANTVAVEWYFECLYEGSVDSFDGVTIAEFDQDMKICRLREFQSKAEHNYPYGENSAGF